MIATMLVRTSPGLARACLGRRSSYGPSMRSNGLPDRQNVDRSVFVAIMNGHAFRARPFTD
jgi:hypothetical protein